MNARLIFALCSGLCLLALPHASQAQELDSDIGLQPMHVVLVAIPAGATVTYRTDQNLTTAPGAAYPDTVLSLLEWGSLDYLAGSDGWDTSSTGCPGAFAWQPSCFSYHNGTGSTVIGLVVLRAWQSYTGALTRLHGFGSGTPNGPMSISPYGTSPLPVGGASLPHTFSTSSGQRHHITTAHLRGDNASHLLLLSSSDYYNSAEVIHSFNNNGSGVAYGNAAFDQTGLGGIPSQVQVNYGGFGTNVGPLRLLKNHWFDDDHDKDGLSHELEADLGSCDRVSDTSADGRSCSRFEFCNVSPVGSHPICLAQLRDTDHDGLRDDIEVIGYDDHLAQMPRYGANVLHKDVFIEMHTEDRNASTPLTCDGFALGASNLDPRDMRGETSLPDSFFIRAQQIYSQMPAEHNADGLPGITVHFDVGVANPNPTDPAWGDFGGGGDCFTTAQGVGDNYAALCVNTLDTDRSWLFRCGIDRLDDGQANVHAQAYRAGTVTQHVHEIGHLLGLGHSGGFGSAADSINGANRRPLYMSRINYRFEGIDRLGTQGVYNTISFSDGQPAQTTNARFAEEVSPSAGTNLAALQFGSPTERPVLNTLSGEWDVDWDKSSPSGSVTGSGVTHWASYRHEENGRNARGFDNYEAHPELLLGDYGSHSDAVITDDVLLYSFTEDGHLYFVADSDGECDMVPSGGYGQRRRYGPCVSVGERIDSGIDAEAVAMATTLLPTAGGPPADGIVVAFRTGISGNFVDFRTGWVNAQSNASEAAVSLSGGWPSGSQIGLSGFTEVDPVLVEVPASALNPHGGVLLFYQGASGNLFQRHLPAGSTTWSTGKKVSVSGQGDFGRAAGDVAAVAHNGQLLLAARKEGSSLCSRCRPGPTRTLHGLRCRDGPAAEM